jgi:tryptophan synthase beta chain
VHVLHAGGLQAGGEGVMSSKHAATLTKGSPGVLHGSFSYLLQDDEGQIINPHSISAGWVVWVHFNQLN